jgi:hypothetical protein
MECWRTCPQETRKLNLVLKGTEVSVGQWFSAFRLLHRSCKIQKEAEPPPKWQQEMCVSERCNFDVILFNYGNCYFRDFQPSRISNPTSGTRPTGWGTWNMEMNTNNKPRKNCVYVESGILIAVVMNSSALWDVPQFSPCEVNRRFERSCRLHLQGRKISQLITNQR